MVTGETGCSNEFTLQVCVQESADTLLTLQLEGPSISHTLGQGATRSLFLVPLSSKTTRASWKKWLTPELSLEHLGVSETLKRCLTRAGDIVDDSISTVLTAQASSDKGTYVKGSYKPSTRWAETRE